MRDFIFMCEKRKNIAPFLESANQVDFGLGDRKGVLSDQHQAGASLTKFKGAIHPECAKPIRDSSFIHLVKK